MRRMRSGCCARAASGQTAAAPPKSVMNSRRRMCPLRTRREQDLSLALCERAASVNQVQCPLWVISGHGR